MSDHQARINYAELMSLDLLNIDSQEPEQFLSQVEKNNVDDPLNVLRTEFDEAHPSMASYSDKSWSQLDNRVSSLLPGGMSKARSELDALFNNPSGSTYEMSTPAMDKGIKDLRNSVAVSPLAKSQVAENSVMDWAAKTKRSLTGPLIKALISAILYNPWVKEEDYEKIILGWDLRGDHNVNEIKNAIDSIQRTLNDVLGFQKESKESNSSILKGIENAYGRIISLHERSIPVTTPIYLPDAPTASVTTVTPKKSNLPNVQPRSALSLGEGTSTGMRIVSEPKTVDNLFKRINRSRNDFKKVLPDKEIDQCLGAFVKYLSVNEWESLKDTKTSAAVMKKLHNYIEKVIKNLEEAYAAKGKDPI